MEMCSGRPVWYGRAGEPKDSYEFLEGAVTVLIGTIKPSGTALAYKCTAKGPSDQWVVEQFMRHLEA